MKETTVKPEWRSGPHLSHSSLVRGTHLSEETPEQEQAQEEEGNEREGKGKGREGFASVELIS